MPLEDTVRPTMQNNLCAFLGVFPTSIEYVTLTTVYGLSDQNRSVLDDFHRYPFVGGCFQALGDLPKGTLAQEGVHQVGGGRSAEPVSHRDPEVTNCREGGNVISSTCLSARLPTSRPICQAWSFVILGGRPFWPSCSHFFLRAQRPLG